MELTDKEKLARERICLALDVDTVDKALSLVDELFDLVGVFKVGKELHCTACNEGVPIVQEIHKRGGKVFLDLKFHDTPQTIYSACKAAVVPGVRIINLHIAGGEEMCKKAIQGAKEKATQLDIATPKVVGVTLLTSLNDEDLKKQGLGIGYDQLALRRTILAKEWGLDGIVCPANKAKELQSHVSEPFLFVTPGIEWQGKYGSGQKQLYTPELALRDCNNSILVIGSAITKAKNKRETAYNILSEMVRAV